MGCCSSLLKYLVFIFNLVFFICGCVMIGFGAYMYVEVNSYHRFFGNSYLGAPIVLIVVGVLLAVVTFFGCCGAVSENSCMMMTFGVAMALILIAEIGVAIAILVFKSDVMEIVSKEMTSTQSSYEKDKEIAVVWDSVQSEFGCCGVKEYTDWKGILTSGPSDVPDSCCIDDGKKDCGKGAIGRPDAAKYVHTEGCLDKFVTTVEDNAVVAGAVGATLGVLQLIIVITSCFLSKRMGEARNYA